MVQHKAHNVADRPRTEDIQINEEIDFKSMLLPKSILKGLNQSGYKKPSPIQKQALPLARCGFDLIVQAKAGTGKTCVFSLAALEMVQPHFPHLQAVILAPTREIALQITDVITALGQNISDLKTSCFIGGYPLHLDKEKARKCQIAVGTPGRMRQLMTTAGLLVPKHTRLFVLDEADKLMESVFVKDINAIYSSLPESKQVLACSATYTPKLVEFLSGYMHCGQYVTPQSSTDSTVLLGVRQFVSLLPHHVDKLATLRLKERRLLDLLRLVSFDQCLVFSNLHSRAESVCKTLCREGWAAEWIAGRQKQEDRVAALAQLKEQRVRVLVTTDLTARGIDVENVNLIINLDLPTSHETYLHRMGRAGRYGSHGMVVTILSKGGEVEAFQRLLGRIGGSSVAVNVVPETLKDVDLWTVADSQLEKVQGVLAETARDESGDSTDTDEKLSKESSDDESSGSVLNGLVSEETAQDTCGCGLYEVNPDSVEVLTGPSLFSVQEKESHCRDVSSISVNEFRVPLGTRVTLLGSKVIRVKHLDENLDDSSSKCQDVVDTNIPFEKGFHIDFEKNSKKDLNVLCFKEIKEILETGPPECKVENYEEIKKVSFSNQEALKERLQEFQMSKEKVEHSLKAFDSFDLVGWMAVDEKLNILESLKLDQSNVYRFDMVKCSSGKNHITVTNTFENATVEEDNCYDTISALKLEDLKLIPPISLSDIAKCLTNSGEKNLVKTKEKIERVKTKNKINGSITLQKKLKQKENNQNFSNDKQKRHNDASTNKTTATNHFDTRPKNGVCNKIKRNTMPKSQETSANILLKNKQNSVKKVLQDTNALLSSSSVSSSCKESSEYLSQSYSAESDINSSDRHLITNGQSHLSSSECSGPSHRTPFLEHKKTQLKGSSESRDVKEYESDSNSDSFQSSSSHANSESDTFLLPNISKREKKIYSSSSDCSYEITNETTTKDGCIKLKRNCKNKDKSHHNLKHSNIHNVTSESYASVESEISNCLSYQTASLESTVCASPNNLLCNSSNSCREDFYSQPSCSYTSKSTQSQRSHRTVPNESTAKRTEFTRKSLQKSASHSKEHCQSASNKTHNQFRPNHQTTQETYNNPKPSSLKVLTSNNLFADWYSTWYSEVRRRARQLEYMEYMNAMVSPR